VAGLCHHLFIRPPVTPPPQPSTTARAAGVFVPIITSLAKSFDSLPSESQLLGFVGPVADASAGCVSPSRLPVMWPNQAKPTKPNQPNQPIKPKQTKTNQFQPDDPSSKRLGEFLFMSQAQVSSATSAMFFLGGEGADRTGWVGAVWARVGKCSRTAAAATLKATNRNSAVHAPPPNRRPDPRRHQPGRRPGGRDKERL
jgi:hypothetical protein